MIEIDRVIKVFRTSSGERIRALDDVSLSLPDKGLIFVVGKSGSGKSTLLNCLGGIEHPDSGKIVFNGKDIVSFNGHSLDKYRQNSVGFCFQKYNIIGDLSVADNIRLAGEAKGGNPQSVGDALSLVGLSGFEKRKASELSGGQQQRVAIARSIYKHPAVILADEPTGALDAETGKQIFETFKKVSLSCLVIVVTHDVSSAEEYGDRIIGLSDGKVVSDRALFQGEPKGAGEKPFEPRVPLSIKAKLCFNSLRKMPIRLCLTILLLGCSFGALGPVLGTLMRDDDEMLADSIVSSDARYLSFSKERNTSGSYAIRKMFPSDVSSLSEEYNEPFLPVYNGVESLINYSCVNFIGYDVVAPDSKSLAYYLQGPSAGVTPISDAILNEQGLSLAFGTLPANENECLIPLCQYEQYAKYGFLLDLGDTPLPAAEIQTPAAFLGFTPSLFVNFGFSSGSTMKIVGLVDTKLNYGDYPETIDAGTQKGNAAMCELEEEFSYGPNRLVFVSPSVIEKNFSSNQAIEVRYSEKVQFDDSSYQQSYKSLSLASSSNSVALAGSGNGNSIYLPQGAFGEVLKAYTLPLDSEEAVDYSPCKTYFTRFSSLQPSSALLNPTVLFAAPTSDYSSALSMTACGSYVKENGLPSEENQLSGLIKLAQSDYDAALSSGIVSKAIDFSLRSSETDDILKSFYVSYLASFYRYLDVVSESGGFLANPYGPETGYEITFDFSKKLLSRMDIETTNITIEAESEADGKLSYAGVLGGLFLDPTNFNHIGVGFSSGLFDSAKYSFGDNGPIAFALMKCLSDKGLVKKAVTEGKNGETAVRYVLHNRCLAAFEYMGYSFGYTLVAILLVISIVLVIFSIILLLTVISSAAKARSKEMTIMRCLGVSKFGVFSQYLAESCVIGLFSFVLALVLNLVLVPVLNGYVASISGLSLAFFGISFGSMALILLLILLGCFVSSFFPAFVSSTKSLSRRLNDD